MHVFRSACLNSNSFSWNLNGIDCKWIILSCMCLRAFLNSWTDKAFRLCLGRVGIILGEWATGKSISMDTECPRQEKLYHSETKFEIPSFRLERSHMQLEVHSIYVIFLLANLGSYWFQHVRISSVSRCCCFDWPSGRYYVRCRSTSRWPNMTKPKSELRGGSQGASGVGAGLSSSKTLVSTWGRGPMTKASGAGGTRKGMIEKQTRAGKWKKSRERGRGRREEEKEEEEEL